jgi:methionyl aminopeptidase
MIVIKNKASLRKMEQAGKLLGEIFDEIKPLIKPGMSTGALDQEIEKRIAAKGLVSKTKGYMGYQHASCISLNDEVVHGVPMNDKIIKEGDLVKVDVCVSWKGYCADMARAFFVGEMPADVKKLVANAKRALKRGISMARPGNTVSDISAAIQHEIELEGFGVVRDFAGHGIGKQMHEEPELLNYGEPGHGPVLRPGMTFAIEPMVTMGKHDVYICNDGWTVKTADNSLAMHIEDTVAVTENEPKVLTKTAADAA